MQIWGPDAMLFDTIEPRDGHLCVFMPPVATLEDYLELLEAVEESAKALLR
jgi:uncharacterized protein (DUF2126 family)